MEGRGKVIELNAQEINLEKELSNLIYGAVEVREVGNKKYIYTHYREEGISCNKYVGEYTEDLYNLILNNNSRAKIIKQELRRIKKELKALGFVENGLDESVMINIDFARKSLVDTIYKQAVLEGIATTYADTETIIEGGKVNNMAITDVLKVVNLKRAWDFILNKGVIASPTNFSLLCEINKFIEEGFYYSAGKVRSTPVSIGGTSWKPSIPIESQIKEDLQTILNSNLEIVDKAIELLLFVMKSQIFIDGNKRTAVIFANHLVISNAKGLIVIPNDKVEIYKSLLISYYEGRDEKSIRQFLKQSCYIRI